MAVARAPAVNEYNRNKSEIADRNARRSPIYVASVTGNFKDLLRLIKEGESINARGDNNNTPLIAACELRRSVICKVLIENGAEVHVTNKLGKTALHKAVYNGLLPIVKMLLDKGVNLNVQDDVYGNTPLHKACEYDQYEAARLLILKGCDTNLKNKSGRTALQMGKPETRDKISEYMKLMSGDLRVETMKAVAAAVAENAAAIAAAAAASKTANKK